MLQRSILNRVARTTSRSPPPTSSSRANLNILDSTSPSVRAAARRGRPTARSSRVPGRGAAERASIPNRRSTRTGSDLIPVFGSERLTTAHGGALSIAAYLSRCGVVPVHGQPARREGHRPAEPSWPCSGPDARRRAVRCARRLVSRSSSTGRRLPCRRKPSLPWLPWWGRSRRRRDVPAAHRRALRGGCARPFGGGLRVSYFIASPRSASARRSARTSRSAGKVRPRFAGGRGPPGRDDERLNRSSSASVSPSSRPCSSSSRSSSGGPLRRWEDARYPNAGCLGPHGASGVMPESFRFRSF